MLMTILVFWDMTACTLVQ